MLLETPLCEQQVGHAGKRQYKATLQQGTLLLMTQLLLLNWWLDNSICMWLKFLGLLFFNSAVSFQQETGSSKQMSAELVLLIVCF